MNKKSMRAFHVIWFGQMISWLGSATSDFALSVWVFQQTGSVLQFSLMALATMLPRLLISPLAGVIVDRWNRRLVMLLSDLAHALFSSIVLLLIYFDQLQIWHLYIISAFSAMTSAFQQPAYQALIPQLVAEDDLGRANGQVDLARGVAQFFSPLIGGFLLGWLALVGVVLIDLVTFAVGAITLLAVRVPNLERREARGQTRRGVAVHLSWWQEFKVGWLFMRAHPGLLALMLYIALTVFTISAVEILVTPLVLSFANEQVLGVILTVGGLGMLIGGGMMSAWGGPQPRIYGMLVFDFLAALALIAAGWQASAVLLAMAAFLFFAGIPFSQGSAQAIWQSVVPQHLQGRVFSTRDMLAIAASPLAYLLSGPLADGIFEPAMASDGRWAAVLGPWLGVGDGRGIGLMFVGMGVLFLLVNLVAWCNPSLRRVEDPHALARQALFLSQFR